MFNKILFATTASPTCDHAAKVAFDLAKEYNSDLHIFHVYGIPTRGASPFITDVRTGLEESTDEDYAAWVKEELKTTYDSFLQGMERAIIRCSVGSPATEILRCAWKEEVDLIILGGHTRQEDAGAFRHRQISGSTMLRVTCGALCPVLIVSQPVHTSFWRCRDIVFSTDFSKTAMAAFKLACRMVDHIGCKLLLFHAFKRTEMSSEQSEGQKVNVQRIAEARRRMQELYGSQMKGKGNWEIEVREGLPDAQLLNFTREKSAALIIMAHHAREAHTSKAGIGDTIENLALQSICPVVSVNRAERDHRRGSTSLARI
ncbi:MAG: universal stress protein [Desulfobacteraceae bacterium]|nr:universal stress protein [Desulfobacteraceae bacterium]